MILPTRVQVDYNARCFKLNYGQLSGHFIPGTGIGFQRLCQVRISRRPVGYSSWN